MTIDRIFHHGEFVFRGGQPLGVVVSQLINFDDLPFMREIMSSKTNKATNFIVYMYLCPRRRFLSSFTSMTSMSIKMLFPPKLTGTFERSP